MARRRVSILFLRRMTSLPRTFGRYFFVRRDQCSPTSPTTLPSIRKHPYGMREILLLSTPLLLPSLDMRVPWAQLRRGFGLFSTLSSKFVKVDTDTFFFPENLRRYVTRMKFDPSQQHFFGHRLRHLRPTYTIAGSSSVFSRGTLRVFSNSTGVDVDDQDCRDSDAELEEPNVGACLRKNGVEARDAFDEHGKEQFMIFQPMHHLQIYPPKDGKPGKNWPNDTENDWFLGHGNPQTNWGKDYPSESPIAFHAFKGEGGREKMRALYSLFTDPTIGNQSHMYRYDEESKEKDYFLSLDSGFPPLG